MLVQAARGDCWEVWRPESEDKGNLLVYTRVRAKSPEATVIAWTTLLLLECPTLLFQSPKSGRGSAPSRSGVAARPAQLITPRTTRRVAPVVAGLCNGLQRARSVASNV